MHVEPKKMSPASLAKMKKIASGQLENGKANGWISQLVQHVAALERELEDERAISGLLRDLALGHGIAEEEIDRRVEKLRQTLLPICPILPSNQTEAQD